MAFFSCGEKKTATPDSLQKPHQVEVNYAKGFSIKKGEGYTLFTVFFNSRDSSSFILDFNGQVKSDLPIIKHPVNRVACLTTTVIPFFDKLESLDAIIAMAYLQFVQNKSVKKLSENGSIFNLSNTDVDTELLLAMGCRVLLSNSKGNLPIEQLNRCNIIPIYFTEYNENHPLAKAEWIKFFGALLDKEEEALKIFTEIEKNYLTVKNHSKNTGTKPKILFGYEYQGKWSAPGGMSYINQLIEDAGGEYFYTQDNSTGSLYLDMEELVITSQGASSWMIVSQYSQSPLLSQLAEENKYHKTFAEQTKGNVYLCNTLKNRYFEDAILEPDILLKDFVNAVFPEKNTTYTARYFVKLK